MIGWSDAEGSVLNCGSQSPSSCTVFQLPHKTKWVKFLKSQQISILYITAGQVYILHFSMKKLIKMWLKILLLNAQFFIIVWFLCVKRWNSWEIWVTSDSVTNKLWSSIFFCWMELALSNHGSLSIIGTIFHTLIPTLFKSFFLMTVQYNFLRIFQLIEMNDIWML